MTQRPSKWALGFAPVAFVGGALLLALSPLLRGGNRWVALIPLELLGLLVLVALLGTSVFSASGWACRVRPDPVLASLALSPALAALVQLTPLPHSWWQQAPGHELYAQALDALGLASQRWRPLSIAPDATVASLTAAIPIVATLALGHSASLHRLKTLLRVVVGVGFVEVVLGVLQVSGGEYSPLFFGVQSFGPPVGTFANRNHYANYLAMALAAYVWLAFDGLRYQQRERDGSGNRLSGGFTNRHALGVWVAVGLLLVLGILLSRSRGGALFGLGAAVLALAAAALRANGLGRGLRLAFPIAFVLTFGAAALMGFDSAISRVTTEQLASSANFRAGLAKATIESSWAFWPWGSGWGTFDLAFQHFQPAWFAAYPNHAHMDYAEFLLEGGVLFVLAAGCFVWLAGRRVLLLGRSVLREGRLDREAMAAALCGIGLLGFLLHSLVDFNMRIPANAMLAALLAGAFLRPLAPREPAP